jgi:uncharacterized protein (TIGR00255 family)
MSATGPQSTSGDGASTAPKSRKTLRSMTGYAQAQAVENGWSLRISIRSVNHRFLDLHVRAPEGFGPLEPRIRQIVREHVHRGHLDVTLYHELAGPAAVGVNEEIAAAYVHAVNSLRRKFAVEAEPDLAAILRLPGVIGSPIASVDEQIERLEKVVARCLSDALDKLDRMREAEAHHLREEMSGRLRTIAGHAAIVTSLAERARPAFARRLEQRLTELLGEAQIDSARLAQ